MRVRRDRLHFFFKLISNRLLETTEVANKKLERRAHPWECFNDFRVLVFTLTLAEQQLYLLNFHASASKISEYYFFQNNENLTMFRFFACFKFLQNSEIFRDSRSYRIFMTRRRIESESIIWRFSNRGKKQSNTGNSKRTLAYHVLRRITGDFMWVWGDWTCYK